MAYFPWNHNWIDDHLVQGKMKVVILQRVCIQKYTYIYIYIYAVNYIVKHILQRKNFAFLLIPSFAV